MTSAERATQKLVDDMVLGIRQVANSTDRLEQSTQALLLPYITIFLSNLMQVLSSDSRTILNITVDSRNESSKPVHHQVVIYNSGIGGTVGVTGAAVESTRPDDTIVLHRNPDQVALQILAIVVPNITRIDALSFEIDMINIH